MPAPQPVRIEAQGELHVPDRCNSVIACLSDSRASRAREVAVTLPRESRRAALLSRLRASTTRPMNFAPRTLLRADDALLDVAVEAFDFLGAEYRALHRALVRDRVPGAALARCAASRRRHRIRREAGHRHGARSGRRPADAGPAARAAAPARRDHARIRRLRPVRLSRAGLRRGRSAASARRCDARRNASPRRCRATTCWR